MEERRENEKDMWIIEGESSNSTWISRFMGTENEVKAELIDTLRSFRKIGGTNYVSGAETPDDVTEDEQSDIYTLCANSTFKQYSVNLTAIRQEDIPVINLSA